MNKLCVFFLDTGGLEVLSLPEDRIADAMRARRAHCKTVYVDGKQAYHSMFDIAPANTTEPCTSIADVIDDEPTTFELCGIDEYGKVAYLRKCIREDLTDTAMSVIKCGGVVTLTVDGNFAQFKVVNTLKGTDLEFVIDTPSDDDFSPENIRKRMSL